MAAEDRIRRRLVSARQIAAEAKREDLFNHLSLAIEAIESTAGPRLPFPLPVPCLEPLVTAGPALFSCYSSAAGDHVYGYASYGNSPLTEPLSGCPS